MRAQRAPQQGRPCGSSFSVSSFSFSRSTRRRTARRGSGEPASRVIPREAGAALVDDEPRVPSAGGARAMGWSGYLAGAAPRRGVSATAPGGAAALPPHHAPARALRLLLRPRPPVPPPPPALLRLPCEAGALRVPARVRRAQARAARHARALLQPRRLRRSPPSSWIGRASCTRDVPSFFRSRASSLRIVTIGGVSSL